MNIYGLQISDSEENKRVSSLLTLEDKELYSHLCRKLENELRLFKRDVSIDLFFPFQVFTDKQVKHNPGTYPGLIDICIVIGWDFVQNSTDGKKYPLSSCTIHFDFETEKIFRLIDPPVFLNDYLEIILPKIKKGEFDYNQ